VVNRPDSPLRVSSTASPTPAQVISELKAGHERFKQANSIHPHASEARLHELEQGQAPYAAVLTCSDSRVAVELIFDSGFGDLFVIRNAGNSATPGTLASVEYAVEALQVPLVLVMSHSGCGAVGAACRPEHLLTPTLMDHVGHIRNGLKGAGLPFEPQVDLTQAYGLHAQITARELINSSALLRQRLSSGQLEVHAACFELHNLGINWLGSQCGA
jgi:carbonic anhydrase